MTAAPAPLFDVVAVAANGAVQSRRVSAQSEQQATQQLQVANLRVLSCRPASAPRWALAALRPRRRARLEVCLFAEELAALLDAGLGMVDAIRTLALKERDESARRAVDRVATDLTEGLPLSQALTVQPETFPALLIATVAASEQTGDLVSALRRYAAHLETLYELRNKVLGAAIYPALLLAVGGLVVLFLLGVVVPRFAQLLEGAHRDLPAASSFLLSWGKAISAHPWIFLGTLVAAGTFLVSQVLRAMRNGWQIPGLQRLWIVGPLVRMFRHAQFFRTAPCWCKEAFPPCVRSGCVARC